MDLVDSLTLDDDCLDDKRLRTAEKCWAKHCDLDAWFRKNSREIYKTEIEAPNPIEFDSLAIASLSIRYWGTATLLYQSLERALRFSRNKNFALYIDHPSGRYFARLIARSLKWLFRKDNGITGATEVSFPLGIAMMYFRQSDLPDPDYMNMVFCAWSDPDWPTSIKEFLRSKSNSIQLPTIQRPKNPVKSSTNELEPILDRDGNVLGGPFINQSRFQELV